MKCWECDAELGEDAKFCWACGTQVGMKKDVFQISPEKLIEKFKEITKDASVKRVVVKDEKGKVLLSIPMTWGAAGALATLALAPWLAAPELSQLLRPDAHWRSREFLLHPLTRRTRSIVSEH